MKSLGIELDSNRLCYVVVTREAADGATVVASGKLQLAETREADDVRLFATEIGELVEKLAPDRIAIKAKPESGQMRAGAAALKMEAILLAKTSCDVYFLTPQRLKLIDDNPALFVYLQGAWKAAIGGFDPPKKKPAAKKGAKPR